MITDPQEIENLIKGKAVTAIGQTDTTLEIYYEGNLFLCSEIETVKSEFGFEDETKLKTWLIQL